MAHDENFSFGKLLGGPLNWRNYLKLGVFVVCALVVYSVYSTVMSHFFPKRPSATSETVTTVGKGGVANITNINNPPPSLKQGIYGRLASDRGSIGVFKEVMANIDVSIGAGKDWHDDHEFIELETRYKF